MIMNRVEFTDSDMMIGYLIHQCISNDNSSTTRSAALAGAIHLNISTAPVSADKSDQSKLYSVFIKNPDKEFLSFSILKGVVTSPFKWVEWLRKNKDIHGVLNRITRYIGNELAEIGKMSTDCALNAFVTQANEWEALKNMVLFCRSSAAYMAEILQKYYRNGKRIDNTHKRIWYSMTTSIAMDNGPDGSMKIILQGFPYTHEDPNRIVIQIANANADVNSMVDAICSDLLYKIKTRYISGNEKLLNSVYNILTTNVLYVGTKPDGLKNVSTEVFGRIRNHTGIESIPSWLVVCWSPFEAVSLIICGVVHITVYASVKERGYVILAHERGNHSPMFDQYGSYRIAADVCKFVEQRGREES